MRHDPCCARCRTPSGVCATGRTCGHHLIYAAQYEEREVIDYPDPTGNAATAHADQERDTG